VKLWVLLAKGEIILEDNDITNNSPQKIIDKGLGYIPEDRLHTGIIPSFSVKENLILKDYYNYPFSNNSFLRRDIIKTHCAKLVKEYDIKCPDIETSTASLSGGNIQKLILAREITRNPGVLVAAYPIRGLDIGAAEYIHERLLEARDRNMGILLITEELDEILNLCDRVAVIYEGKILKIMRVMEASKSKLGLLMAGIV